MKSEFIGNSFGMCESVHVTGVVRGVLLKASGIFLRFYFKRKENDHGAVNILHAFRHLILKHFPHKSNFNN